MREMTLRHFAAVPVGHDVRITTYECDVGIVRVVVEPRPEYAVVEDLTTGIQYAPSWVWERDRQSPLDDQHHGFTEQLQQHVREVDSFTGRVTSCKVFTHVGNAGNHQLVTMLVIDC